MPIVVVYQPSLIIHILRREPIRVVFSEIVRRYRRTAAYSRDRAEWRVFVVRRDTVGLLNEDEFGHVLVAVVGIEEIVLAVLLECERTRRDGFCRIPAENKVDGIVGCDI